jgi:hypothetical protein
VLVDSADGGGALANGVFAEWGLATMPHMEDTDDTTFNNVQQSISSTFAHPDLLDFDAVSHDWGGILNFCWRLARAVSAGIPSPRSNSSKPFLMPTIASR